MGALLSVFGKVKKKNVRVLLLGLDNAGKTTIIKQLGLLHLYSKQEIQQSKDKNDMTNESDIKDTVPTVGFNVREIQYKHVKFSVWDLSGQQTIRSLWKHYFKGTTGIIYIVDTSDRNRLEESRLELFNLLKAEELLGIPLLVFGNKCDKEGALSTNELIAKFKLEDLSQTRSWYVQSCSGYTGEGIVKGLEWFVELL